MRFPLILAAALIAGAGLATAQEGPAELPPASFAGDEYVDSRGCVFSRATLGGATRWVPLTGLNRDAVCGRTPSLPAETDLAADDDLRVPVPTETAADAAPAPAATAAPELTTAPVAARQPAPAAARDIVLPPPPLETRAAMRPRVPARPVAPRSASRATHPAPVATVPTGRLLDRRARAAAALSGRRIGRVIEGDQYAARVAVPAGATRIPAGVPSPLRTASVREQGFAHVPRPSRRTVCGDPDKAPGYSCGSVHVSHSGPTASAHPRRARAARAAAALAAAEAAPVLSTRTAGVVTVPPARTTFDYAAPPHGWRLAWDDGRLNPLRGPQTLRGDTQSQAIWTNDVPRQLRHVVRIGDRAGALPKH